MTRQQQNPNNRFTPDKNQKFFITDFDLQRLRKTMMQYKNIIAFCDRESLDELCQKLISASVVNSREISPDVVTMNSTFVLRENEGKETVVYTLVFPEKSNINENKISVLSPLGCSILGRSIHDIVENPVPVGVQKLVVEKIIYQPERAGDFHL